MDIPTDTKYTENDEWVRVEGDIGYVGITDYAQEQLSDIVYVEIIVSEDETLEQGETCATIESVKAAADVYLPVSGKVIAINDNLDDMPELVNQDPYGEAWMVKIEISDSSELEALLDAASYKKLIEEKES